MKKFISILSIVLILASCSTKQANQDEVETTEKAMNSEEKDLNYQEVEIDGEPALVGEINQEMLQGENYNTWYSFFKEDYKTNSEIVTELKDKINDYDVKVFIGTWCSDSQDKGPAFFKVLEEAGYDMSKVQMFSLDRDKKGLNGEEAEYGVSHVPTFLFMKDGEEAGRIVENPINSIEEDVRDILNGTPQTPNYAE